MALKQYNFEVNDFVRLNSFGWRRYENESITNDNVLQIKEIVPNGFRFVEFEDNIIPKGYVEPIPIDGESDKSIYYDPIIEASFISPGETPPEHNIDYSYYIESFKKSYYYDGRTLYKVYKQRNYKYVHEIQHWLRRDFGIDELKIHHSYKPVIQVYVDELWNLRKDFIRSNVPAHLFIYELCILLYIKFTCDKKLEQTFPYRWEQLETVGNKLELYHQDATRIGEFSNLTSEQVLRKAMATINKIDISYYGDLLVSLIQKENNDPKSVIFQYSSSYKILKTAVEVLKPKDGEEWDDPAAGTCGTMVELNDYMNHHSINLDLSGCEIYSSAAWIGKCNLLFHDISCNLQHCNVFDRIPKRYDGIVCDLPLGYAKIEGRKNYPVKTDNRQLNYIMEICTSLKDSDSSRAAFTLPDVFFLQNTEDVVAVKQYLFGEFNIPLIVKLPSDTIRSSVNMSLVFITKSNKPVDVWIYDARNKNNGQNTKTNNHGLKDFVASVIISPDSTAEYHKGREWSLLRLQDVIASNYSFDINKDFSDNFFDSRSALESALNLSKSVTKELTELMKKIEDDK